MTGRRYSDSCNSVLIVSDSDSDGRGRRGSCDSGDSAATGSDGSDRGRRHNKLRFSPSGQCRRVRTDTTAAVMHVKKTWKNAAVMLLAAAVVTTATAAFYFNYAATSECCAVGRQRGDPSGYYAADDERNDGHAAVGGGGGGSGSAAAAAAASKFVSSIVRASKLYAVCEIRHYRRHDDRGSDGDRLYRSRRQAIDSTTTNTLERNPSGESLEGNGRVRNSDGVNDTALIYFITPTYPRREQIAELTRLGQTLMLVPRLHWIVADDRPDCSQQIKSLLPDFSIPYTYIASPMPTIYKHDLNAMPRGVSNRRAALNWIRLNHDANDSNAVIYFGDDDNTFHLDLFKEIRTTKKISMFPVGLVGDYGVSAPIIDKGKVVGFFDSWPAKRKFPVDMAGFAINVQLLFKYPYATMPYKAGFEEDRFLSALAIRLEEIEPKAENCTKILVWHTQTAKKPKPIVMVKSKATLPGSLATLLDQITLLGIGEVSETTGVRSYITKHGNIFRV